MNVLNIRMALKQSQMAFASALPLADQPLVCFQAAGRDPEGRPALVCYRA